MPHVDISGQGGSTQDPTSSPPAGSRCMAGQSKRCSNEACQTPELPVKGGFCTAARCKRRRAEQTAAKKLIGAGSSSALVAGDDGSLCFEVYAVYGVSCCDVAGLTPWQRRNEVDEENFCWSYDVFGRFGLTEDDNGYDDTRRVSLAELVKNVDDVSLEVLQSFDKDLKKKARAARKAAASEMLEEYDDDDEALAEGGAAPVSPELAPIADAEAVC
jgi:hypothetical protein